MVRIQILSDNDLGYIMKRWELRDEQRSVLNGMLNGILFRSASENPFAIRTKEIVSLEKNARKYIKKLLNKYDEYYEYFESEIPKCDENGNIIEYYSRSTNFGADENTQKIITLLREAEEIIELPTSLPKRAKGNIKNVKLEFTCKQLHEVYFHLTGLRYISRQPTPGNRVHTPFTEVLQFIYENYVDKSYRMQSENSFNKSVENYLKEDSKQK